MNKYRYTSIDLSRLFFSFCVVLIHVPILGSSYMTPILRCAVPFFYIVSGYFLFDDDSNQLKRKLRKNIYKWFFLYIKSFLVITLISCFLHLYYNQTIEIDLNSILEIISGQGTCKSLDVIKIGEYNYGLYVLWFLLSGCYVFIYYYYFYKLLYGKLYYIAILFICILSVLFEITGIKLPKVLSLALPFITIGIGIKKFENQINRFGRFSFFMLSLILCYIEWGIFRYFQLSGEYYFITPYLASVIFLLILNFKVENCIFTKLSNIGNTHTLYIYIYHRCVYLFLIIFWDRIILPFAALLCFVVTLLLSIFISKLCVRLKI